MVGKTQGTELVYERSDRQVAVLMPPSSPVDPRDQKVVRIGSSMEDRVICVECRTTRTPMWRSGPTGPRSLCNACGIRYRKKRRQEMLGVVVGNGGEENADNTSELKNLEVVKKRRVVMGVEEAAVLLMALSSDPACFATSDGDNSLAT